MSQKEFWINKSCALGICCHYDACVSDKKNSDDDIHVIGYSVHEELVRLLSLFPVYTNERLEEERKKFLKELGKLIQVTTVKGKV